jgi:hypothetical protein
MTSLKAMIAQPEGWHCPANGCSRVATAGPPRVEPCAVPCVAVVRRTGDVGLRSPGPAAAGEVVARLHGDKAPFETTGRTNDSPA